MYTNKNSTITPLFVSEIQKILSIINIHITYWNRFLKHLNRGTRSHKLLKKNPSSRYGTLPLRVVWQGGPKSCSFSQKNNTNYFNCSLVTYHNYKYDPFAEDTIYFAEHREMRLDLSWNFPPCELDFTVLEDSMPAAREGKVSNGLSYKPCKPQ